MLIDTPVCMLVIGVCMYAMHFPLVHQRYTRTNNNELTHQTRVSVTDASGVQRPGSYPIRELWVQSFRRQGVCCLVVVHGPLPTFNIRYRVEQSSFISFTSLFHSVISAISFPPSSAPLPFTGRHRRFFSLALIVRSSSSTAHSSHCKLRLVEHIVSQCLLLRPTVLPTLASFAYCSFPIFNPYSFLSY